MSLLLEQLAGEVGVHERTLRRATAGGLIRAHRPSSRRLSLSEQEMAWVRSRWPVVSRLLAALRTEPNVELAVLFGSVARGTDVQGVSDVDLLIDLRRPAPGALEALRQRLEEQLHATIELIPLKAALRDPGLLSEILRDGRPLVDRGEIWPGLWTQRARTRAQADRADLKLHEQARAAVGYFQRLAAERAQPPAAGAR
ncbi:MAG TPA: nucleotidyltransferase domain-containing protein [Solirubrobacteraceae bacterium]|jgi:predicted nucleotidyltransferase|nr:nucleotidyltransferase domain-containing protein [Solirubrobacteraceae bacterium]